jgi:hypothetical protein
VKQTTLRRVLLPVVLTILSGCAHTYNVSRPVAAESTPTLSRDATAYVALPQDGSYEGRVYEGSGRYTVSAVSAAFSSRLEEVAVARSVEEYEPSLEAARAGGHDYLIFPEIKHWEDRATEWSGKSDKIEVRITIVETRTGDLVDSVDIRGTSRWGTLGGDHPQDLLAVPIEDFVAEAFGEQGGAR